MTEPLHQCYTGFNRNYSNPKKTATDIVEAHYNSFRKNQAACECYWSTAKLAATISVRLIIDACPRCNNEQCQITETFWNDVLKHIEQS